MAQHQRRTRGWTSRLRSFFVAAILTAGVTSGQIGASVPQAYAAPNSILWGAYVNGAPWDAAKLDAFEHDAGKGQSIIHWGQPWFHDNKYQPFQTKYFDMAREHGSVPMLTWGSWDYANGVN